MANVNLKVGKRMNRTFDIKAVVNVFELMDVFKSRGISDFQGYSFYFSPTLK